VVEGLTRLEGLVWKDAAMRVGEVGHGEVEFLSNAHLQRCEAIWSRGSKEQTRSHIMAWSYINRLPIIIQINH